MKQAKKLLYAFVMALVSSTNALSQQNQVALYAPYLPGEKWYVSQAPGGDFTHDYPLHESWDFSWNADPQNPDPHGDLLKPIIASASGKVTFARLSGSLTNGWGYTVVVDLDNDSGYTRVAHIHGDETRS